MLVNFEDVPVGIKVEFTFGSCPALHYGRLPVRPSLHWGGITTSIVWRKSSGRAFIPLLKHGRHFVSMWAARNSGCYLYSEVIAGGRGGGGGGVGDKLAYFTCLDRIFNFSWENNVTRQIVIYDSKPSVWKAGGTYRSHCCFFFCFTHI